MLDEMKDKKDTVRIDMRSKTGVSITSKKLTVRDEPFGLFGRKITIE